MPYKDPEQKRAYQRSWATHRRREFFADKACEWCGSPYELQLHHRDPNEKESHRIWTWSETRRDAEIAKCVVVCEPCHMAAHREAQAVEARLRNGCGTIRAYWRGCRCDSCREARRTYEAGGKRFERSDRLVGDHSLSRRAPSASRAPSRADSTETTSSGRFRKVDGSFVFESARHGDSVRLHPSIQDPAGATRPISHDAAGGSA